jgi:pimeloyl-ACP methyl ester carboxylesterase
MPPERKARKGGPRTGSSRTPRRGRRSRLEELVLHGHRVRFRRAGSGPLLVLIHGITGSSQTWSGVIPALADHHTVIAPDLLGHGESAKPRGDYSLGAYASSIRDLLTALGHERATVVGHSLGGGVAMQFAYQFPERAERLVLVSSGGLGTEVTLLLRLATLPGAEYVLPLLCTQRLCDAGARAGRFFGRLGLRPSPDAEEMASGFASLGDIEARQAFIHTVRGIIDFGGQRVSARDRLYLAAGVPVLIVWGERDAMIPAAHGHATREAVPGSRLEVFARAGHFPHRDDPDRFAEVLLDFIATTRPARIDPAVAQRLLLDGAPVDVGNADVGTRT